MSKSSYVLAPLTIIHWPDKCVYCNGPASGHAPLSYTATTAFYGVAYKEETFQLNYPVCNKHKMICAAMDWPARWGFINTFLIALFLPMIIWLALSLLISEASSLKGEELSPFLTVLGVISYGGMVVYLILTITNRAVKLARGPKKTLVLIFKNKDYFEQFAKLNDEHYEAVTRRAKELFEEEYGSPSRSAQTRSSLPQPSNRSHSHSDNPQPALIQRETTPNPRQNIINVVHPFSVTSEISRATTHNIYGKVVISVEPSSYFAFKSLVQWPGDDYSDAVLRGLREVLMEAGLLSIHACVVLKEISWRENEYCWDSFYYAGKRAGQDILKHLLE